MSATWEIHFNRARQNIKEERYHWQHWYVMVMVFPFITHECESRTLRKAEWRIIYSFELWCWRRLLQIPQITERTNHSVLDEIKPDCFLKALIMNLCLKYLGHAMWKQVLVAWKKWKAIEKERLTEDNITDVPGMSLQAFKEAVTDW